MPQHPCSLGLRGPLALSGPVWVVCTFHTPSPPGGWVTALGGALFQAGHNFYNVDLSYVKKLCGTILGGPKLPQRWVPAPRWGTPLHQHHCRVSKILPGTGERGRQEGFPGIQRPHPPRPAPPPGCRDPARGAGPAPSARVSSSASRVSQLQRERPQV